MDFERALFSTHILLITLWSGSVKNNIIAFLYFPIQYWIDLYRINSSPFSSRTDVTLIDLHYKEVFHVT